MLAMFTMRPQPFSPHPRDEGAAEVEGAGHVDGHGPGPLMVSDLPQRPARADDPRAVDQDADRAAAPGGVPDCLGVGDVELDISYRRDVQRDHVDPVAGETFRAGLAQATGGSGDDCGPGWSWHGADSSRRIETCSSSCAA